MQNAAVVLSSHLSWFTSVPLDSVAEISSELCDRSTSERKLEDEDIMSSKVARSNSQRVSIDAMRV